MQVTLDNVSVGLEVRRGPDWRSRWREDGRRGGVVLGFTDGKGVLHGSNAAQRWDADFRDRTYHDAFWTLDHTTLTETDDDLLAPWRRGQIARDGDTATVGAGWAAVQWASGVSSIYPIGAAGPLGAWWRGGPCHSLLAAAQQ